jgi:uncharacterized protein (DUF1330 family)
MAAYLIVDTDIHDPERYEVYKREVPAFVAKHGGEYLARGGTHEVLEGDWKPVRILLFRFPDRQSIRNLLNDPDYQRLKAVRHATAISHLVAVDGLE